MNPICNLGEPARRFKKAKKRRKPFQSLKGLLIYANVFNIFKFELNPMDNKKKI
jgi:hypothetical protein